MQHLRIPPEFSRLHLHELPDTVILKGPSGNEWLAELHEDIDFVYIQDDGWRNFHRDNALGNSEFLRFHYNGKNCFKVQVFDPTGVERLEVAGAGSMGTKNPSGRRSRGRPRKHPVGSRDLPLSKSLNSQGKNNPELDQDKLEKIQVEESLTKLREEEMDLPDVKMSSEPGNHKKKNKQRQVKAGNLAPHIPVCKSNILWRSLEKNASNSEENARLRAVKETSTSNFPFFVSYTFCPPPGLYNSRQPANKKKLKNDRRKIPDFFKVYRPEYSSQRMRIPRGFLAHLDTPLSGEILLRRRMGRQWRIKVILEAQDAHFEDGWQEFVRDNVVEVNDFMVFSYRSHGLFSVALYGHSTCGNKECALPEEVEGEGEIQERDTDDEDYEEEEEEYEGRRKQSKKGNVGERKAANEDPIDVERYINTKNPYLVTMIPTLRSNHLYVSHTVLNDYELKLPEAVEFQDPNGRTWRGRVTKWKDGRTWISGWRALSRHNNLKKNDRCICEFLEKNGVTGGIIKVHIIRGDGA